MLILTRKREERIFIDDRIIVKVLEVQPGGAVRLGITAPDDVTIVREEIAATVAEAAEAKHAEVRRKLDAYDVLLGACENAAKVYRRMQFRGITPEGFRAETAKLKAAIDKARGPKCSG